MGNPNKKCLNCGTPLSPQKRRYRALYCSDRCQDRYWHKKRTVENKHIDAQKDDIMKEEQGGEL